VPVAGSSDWPVAGFDPLEGLRAAVTRRTRRVHAYEPDQRVTLDEALAMYTRVAAQVSGCADRCGTLATGKRADLVVIDDARLDGDALESVALAPMEGFGGFERLVRSDGGAVRAVVVNGRVAAENGALRPEVGRERGFGGVLRAR